MRLKEFAVFRYGPLQETGRIRLGGFNLFWGENETGKTLLIDALVKLILSKAATGRVFENLQRVDESPEGYVHLYLENGVNVKLPEDGSLLSLKGLGEFEYRNLFVIRDSDLSLSSDEHFYTGITDRLTGLRMEEIEYLKKQLQERGGLTRPSSNGALSNDLRRGKVKQRVERAYALLNEIKSLQIDLEEESFEELELESLKVKEDLSSLDGLLEQMEMARRQKLFQESHHALQELNEALETQEELACYTAEEERFWREVQLDKEKECLNLWKVTEKLKEVIEKLRSSQELQQKAKVELEAARRRKESAEENLLPKLKKYKQHSQQVQEEKAKGSFYTATVFISAALLIVSLLGIARQFSPLFWGFSLFFLLLLILAGTKKYLQVSGKARLAGLEAKIRMEAAGYHLEGYNYLEIIQAFETIREEYRLQENELQILEAELALYQREKDHLEKQKIESEEIIRKAESNIIQIQQKSRAGSLDDYSQKLEKKKKAEQMIESRASLLSSLLGREKGVKQLEEAIAYWQREIEKLKVYGAEGPGAIYSEENYNSLQKKREGLHKQKNVLSQKMDSCVNKLKKVEGKVNELFKDRDDEEYFFCSTSVDLQNIKEHLSLFISTLETRAERARAALEVLEEMEREEEGNIQDLFGEKSPVSAYFSEITGGLYRQVRYNLENRKVEAERENGSVLAPEYLSGGAKDQLYFSIRLALGQKVLGGEKGFFILDDPFLKADGGRLAQQLDLLHKVVNEGWQVLYFSAKEEVRLLLKQQIEKEEVLLFPLSLYTEGRTDS